MKYTGRISVGMALAMSLVLGSQSFAAGYNDISKHWAKPYIEDMGNKGIVSGYSDGTFKPDKSVSRLETLVLLTRLFPASDVDATYTSAGTKWDAKLTAAKIPDWAKKSVVFSLEKGIVPEGYLANIMSSTGAQYDAMRYEVAVNLARALDLDAEMSKVAVLGFKDASKIPAPAVPYIDILIKKGIISSKGDYLGNFNPNNYITRGELAKMLYSSYPMSQASKGGTTIVPPVVPPITPPVVDPTNPTNPGTVTPNYGYVTVKGSIGMITAVGAKTQIVLKDDTGKFTSYSNDTAAISVKLGAQTKTLTDLTVGLPVEMDIKDDKVYNVRINDKEETKEGAFIGITNSYPNKKIQIRVGSSYDSFEVDATTKITKDGKSASLSDLQAEDKCVIVVQAGKAKTIEAVLTRGNIRGNVVSVGRDYIEVSKDRNNFKYDLDRDARFKRNGERTDRLSDIRVGDDVRIDIENSKVVYIDATSVRTTVRGKITEIRLSNTDPQIVISEDDRDRGTAYSIGRKVAVTIDGKSSAGIYDLKINMEVRATVESGELTSVDVSKYDSNVQGSITGKVTVINDRRDESMEIEDSSGKIYYVDCNVDHTKFYDVDFKEVRINNIRRGDTVTVVGEDRFGTFVAKKVIILTQGR